MSKMLIILLFVIFVFSGAGEHLFAQNQHNIIPMPVEMTTTEGTFMLSLKTKIVVLSDNQDVKETAELFNGQLASLIGQKLEISNKKSRKSIVLNLNSEPDSCLGEEGYALSVQSGEITLSANQPAGLFYGVQTLLQLIPPVKYSEPIAISGINIVDYPRFVWRGLMLDVSRHFFTKEEVKRFIDQMVKYKYNIFHWHLTDDQGWRVEIKGMPELTTVGAWSVSRTGRFWEFAPPAEGEESKYGGFCSQEDIREIVKYAQERFVTIVPEIDVPGHSLPFIASYPYASCADEKSLVNAGFAIESSRVLCAGNEDNFKKLEIIFSQIAALFPGQYIHIGGDEADKSYWKKCSKCQERIKTEQLKNEEELQSYFIKRISKILTSNGKKLIGWDEILEGGLADDATVMSWRGTEGGAEAVKAGHHVIMTPNQYCYLDHTQGENVIERYGILFCCLMRMREVYNFEPTDGVSDSSYVMGGQGNIWTEMIPNYRRVEYMTWPRAMALSEIFWSPKRTRDWDEFVFRAESHFPRFKQAEVNYAPSIYDPAISMVKTDNGESRIVFTPEIKGLDIYYTFDCTFPDKFSAKYDGKPISCPKGSSEIWAITYRNGEPVGRLLVITLDELKKRM